MSLSLIVRIDYKYLDFLIYLCNLLFCRVFIFVIMSFNDELSIRKLLDVFLTLIHLFVVLIIISAFYVILVPVI